MRKFDVLMCPVLYGNPFQYGFSLCSRRLELANEVRREKVRRPYISAFIHNVRKICHFITFFFWNFIKFKYLIKLTSIITNQDWKPIISKVGAIIFWHCHFNITTYFYLKNILSRFKIFSFYFYFLMNEESDLILIWKAGGSGGHTLLTLKQVMSIFDQTILMHQDICIKFYPLV